MVAGDFTFADISVSEGLLLARAFDLGACVKPSDHDFLSSMWAPVTQPKEILMLEHIC